MKIKLDENIPLELGPILRAQGHDVDTVPEEGLNGQPDRAVWTTAQTNECFFITQDLDFSDIRSTHLGAITASWSAALANNARVRLVVDGEAEVQLRYSECATDDLVNWSSWSYDYDYE